MRPMAATETTPLLIAPSVSSNVYLAKHTIKQNKLKNIQLVSGFGYALDALQFFILNFCIVQWTILMIVFIFIFSVLLRYATVSELESPDTPYIKRILRVSMKKAEVTQNIVYKSYTNVANGSLDELYINRISNTSVLTRILQIV